MRHNLNKHPIIAQLLIFFAIQLQTIPTIHACMKSFHPSTMCVGERTSEWVKEKREKDLGEINQSELLWRRLTICHNKFLFLIFIVLSPAPYMCAVQCFYYKDRKIFCFLKGIFLVSFHNKKKFFFISESALKDSLGYYFDVRIFLLEKNEYDIFDSWENFDWEERFVEFVIKFLVRILCFWGSFGGLWWEFSSFWTFFIRKM